MQLLTGLFFGVGAASGTVQRTYFIIYEFCFTCFKIEYESWKIMYF